MPIDGRKRAPGNVVMKMLMFRIWLGPVFLGGRGGIFWYAFVLHLEVMAGMVLVMMMTDLLHLLEVFVNFYFTFIFIFIDLLHFNCERVMLLSIMYTREWLSVFV